MDERTRDQYRDSRTLNRPYATAQPHNMLNRPCLGANGPKNRQTYANVLAVRRKLEKPTFGWMDGRTDERVSLDWLRLSTSASATMRRVRRIIIRLFQLFRNSFIYQLFCLHQIYTTDGLFSISPVRYITINS